MTRAERARLRALAEAATPRPWRYCVDPDGCAVVCPGCGEDHDLLAWLADESGARLYTITPADGEYLAAVSPTTIVALLDELERAEQRAEALAKAWWDHCYVSKVNRLAAEVLGEGT